MLLSFGEMMMPRKSFQIGIIILLLRELVVLETLRIPSLVLHPAHNTFSKLCPPTWQEQRGRPHTLFRLFPTNLPPPLMRPRP